jgi:NAD(P)-dependent dehydrogenase (short-subunit alcohol dehydrogenase family)
LEKGEAVTEYHNKTVIVTGGGSGLGAAMADQFAGQGAKIALFDIDGVSAAAKAESLRQAGADAIALCVDVADKASVEAAVEMVRNRFGEAHVLCANVGVQQFGAIDALTDQDWDWVFSVNVRGVINTVQAILPLLRTASGPRHIVLTASASFFQFGVRMAAYVATKYAVVGYGEVLRRELAGEGINVSMLFPAGMATRHLESSVAARPEELGVSRLDMGDIQAMMASSDVDLTQVVSAEYAVRNLLTDLAANEPYIFTHGTYRHQIEAQQQQVLAAFDRMTAHP